MLKRVVGTVFLAISLAGCNMIAAFGRDVERGGEKLQNEARETQQEMKQR
jgi:predicted small secreted protein